MPAFSPRPTYKPIKTYYVALQSLLEHCGHKGRWPLVPEHPIRARHGNRFAFKWIIDYALTSIPTTVSELWPSGFARRDFTLPTVWSGGVQIILKRAKII